LDKEMLAKLVDEFERVMAEGSNPQKKHLLQRDLWKPIAEAPAASLDFYGRKLIVPKIDPHGIRVVGIRKY